MCLAVALAMCVQMYRGESEGCAYTMEVMIGDVLYGHDARHVNDYVNSIPLPTSYIVICIVLHSVDRCVRQAHLAQSRSEEVPSHIVCQPRPSTVYRRRKQDSAEKVSASEARSMGVDLRKRYCSCPACNVQEVPLQSQSPISVNSGGISSLAPAVYSGAACLAPSRSQLAPSLMCSSSC